MRNNNIKSWGSSSLPWCGYTDDLILFTLNVHSLQRAATLLDHVFTNFGLKINESKTETMILIHSYTKIQYPKSIITLRNVSLKNSYEFKYLGSLVSHSEPNTGDIEINHRIQLEQKKFASMTNLLHNRNIFP